MTALIWLQVYAVFFIGLHDWIPLGRLNDVKAVQAADPPGKLLTVTALSTLPFAFGLAMSLTHAGTGFPRWLLWSLWGIYGAAFYGLLRAWWLPYLFFEEPARTLRYQAMFGATHAFLPVRHGIRPNTLHLSLHGVIVAIIILLAVMTFR